MTQTKKYKRILVSSASVGSGHNSAAKALIEQIKNQSPDTEVQFIDAMEYCSKWFRKWYADGFNLSMSRLPKLYALGYVFTSKPPVPKKWAGENRLFLTERFVLKRYADFVCEYQPDLVLHTHFVAPAVISRLCRKGKISARQQVVVTDIIPHRWWTAPDMDCYYVSQPESKDELIRWGVDASRVKISGIPVHPKWIQNQPGRAELCKRWDLPADKKIVLLAGGVEFTCGPILKIAQQIAAQNSNACVVVLTGRNQQLFDKLAELPHAKAGSIVPMGYTTKLPELAEIAELMITKPGGLTTAECLAKSIPMLFLKPVFGQEGNNAKIITARGGGVIARSTKEVIARAGELLSDADKLLEMSRSAGKMYRPGTQSIVENILGTDSRVLTSNANCD